MSEVLYIWGVVILGSLLLSLIAGSLGFLLSVRNDRALSKEIAKAQQKRKRECQLDFKQACVGPYTRAPKETNSRGQSINVPPQDQWPAPPPPPP